MQTMRMIPKNCPFWDRSVTLALAVDGDVSFTTTVAEKVDALSAFERKPRGLLFVAWTGKWRTDLFRVDPKDVKRLLAGRRSKGRQSAARAHRSDQRVGARPAHGATRGEGGADKGNSRATRARR